jgi:CHAD domain-containing protein
MTLTEHARDTLRRLSTRVDDQISLLLADPGVDPVHDLRVAIRRLSQALRMFAHLFDAKEARRMRRSLKPVLDAAAVARDLDVGEELLLQEGLLDTHPLLSGMRAERERAALALLGRVYLLKSEDLPTQWLPRFANLRLEPESAALVARQWLPPVAQDFFKTGRKTILKASTPQRLHAFRLSAKRFRYTLELFRAFYGPVFLQRLEKVRQIQSILGKRQDCAVMAARLEPLAPTDAAIADVLATNVARGLKLEHEFREHWRLDFDAPGEDLLWVRYLARRPPTPHPQP